MNHRIFYLLGVFAPILFVFTMILGGALRPGYSHVTETISELFSPGSPNRLLLTTLHTLYAVSFSLFGFGLLLFVQKKGKLKRIGIPAALTFISVGILSVLTATVFPQDAWGTTPTFFGEMHMIIHGVISLLSILYILLFGVWFHRTGIARFFRAYSMATVVAVLLTAGWFAVSIGGPLMGISERAAMLVGFQWTVLLAVIVLKND
jgi:hypothetical protein